MHADSREANVVYGMDIFVLIEYIKSAIDIILQLKFEEIEHKLEVKND